MAPSFPQPVPPSPNAASLGKYGEIPVGKYTGVPDVTIPLYQIDEGDIKVPVSLSYHASGIKVEENASWVGLGWSLNAGGVITRSVRGLPDENGYLLNGDQDRKIPILLAGNIASLGPSATEAELIKAVNYASTVVEGGYDSEPDMYYFNFNGMSGKFVLDQNGVAYVIPYQKIKIQKENDATWTITTADGMVYRFGEGNSREFTTTTYVSYTGYDGSEAGTTPGSSFASAWYLSKISSPNGRSVSFSYEGESSLMKSGYSQSLTWDIVNGDNFNSTNHVTTSGTRSLIQGVRLTQINFSGGAVNFIATDTRADIIYTQSPGPKLLNRIAISNQNGVIKNFLFNTDYFASADAVQSPDTKRLRLNSVTEWNGNLSQSKQPYFFYYDSSGTIASKISSSQDHWGFYNGKVNTDAANNPTLIPGFRQGALKTTEAGFYTWNTSNLVKKEYYKSGIKLLEFKGANRDPDFNFAKIGVLNKIKYPTGGYTSFEYEPNDVAINPKNYTYTGQDTRISALAVVDPDYNTNAPVDDRMDSNYEKTRTVNLSQYINSSNSDVNQFVYADINLAFDNGGLNFYSCGFSEPTAYFKDLTANKILIQGNGREADIYMDASILSQIGDGTIQISGNFEPTQWPLGQLGWNSRPYFSFKHVRLDPTHIYEFKSIAYYAQAITCEIRPGVSPPPTDPFTSALVQMDFHINTHNVEKYNGEVGGLRIKKITDFKDVDLPAAVKQYTYRQSSNPQISSGVITDVPIYTDEKILLASRDVFQGGYIGLTPIYSLGLASKLISLSSGSKFELGQTAGGDVGYKEVKETVCADGSCFGSPVGYTVYKFTSPEDYPDLSTRNFIELFQTGFAPTSSFGYPRRDFRWVSPTDMEPTGNYYPYPPKNNYDWKRGLLLSEEIYDQNNVLKRKNEASYNLVNDGINRVVIDGVKMIGVDRTLDGVRAWDIYTGRYEIIAAWNYKSQDKVTVYDLNGANPVTTTTNYFYDNPDHAQVTRTETTDSKGVLIQEKNKYVGDETSVTNLTASQTDAIAKLKTNFRFSALIENDVNRNGTLVSRTRNNYKDWGTGYLAPESIQLQVGSNPMETRITYKKYDVTNGNIIEVNKPNGPVVAYHWSYNKQYPVAETNHASDLEFYYEGFEESVAAGTISGTGHTGNKYSTNTTISWTRPNTRTYVISYWYRSDNDWVYKSEQSYSGTSFTLTGGDAYDDIRIYPSDAQMTTYTYDPLVGMTSQTNAAGQTTYYEYDGFQRLINIRDQDGNIIKHTDYHYKGQ